MDDTGPETPHVPDPGRRHPEIHARFRRRSRLIILAVLAPTALVAWQASAATQVEVAAEQTQQVDGPWVETREIVEERSPVLAAFYASDDFDPYVATWLTAQPSTIQYRADCERADARVFLPPFTGRVAASCDALLDGGARGGEMSRLRAFVPIVTRFLRQCRDLDTTPDATYDEDQQVALQRVVDDAVEADCDQEETRTA